MKGKIVLFTLLLYSVLSVYAIGKEGNQENEIHKRQSTQAKIESLMKLARQHIDQPKEISLLLELKELANMQDDKQLCANVYYSLSRHYYNSYKRDSLFYWAGITKDYAKKNQFFDTYFRTENLICLRYYIDYKWDTAIDKAIEMRDEAKALNNAMGQALGVEVVGLIYAGLGDIEEAHKLLLQALELSESTSPLVRFDLLVDVLLSTYRLKKFEAAAGYIAEAQAIVDNFDEKELPLGSVFNAELRKVELTCYKAYLYAHLHQTDKAREYLSKVDSMAVNVRHVYIDYYHGLAASFYYKSIGDYPAALKAIEKALLVEKNPDLLSEKASIFSLMKNDKMAAEFYKQSFLIADSIAKVSSIDRVNRMNMRREMNALTVYTKELEIQKNERVITTIILFLILLFLLLVSLVIILIRMRKLTSKLEKSETVLLREKKDLLETRDHLTKAREEAERAREEAVNASKAKSAFLANMSHEIRTPLNSIIGFSDVLKASLKGDDSMYLSVIKKNAYLLLNLVNDVLDLARCDAGKMQFNFVMCNVLPCCTNALTNVRVLLHAKSVAIKLENELDSLYLYTDPIRFQQVLTNLLTNATKFTQEGSIVLAVTVDQKAKKAFFTVTDTGCGIPPEKQDRIFERFEKLNEFSQGTGLGLSICRVIAENLNGEVELDKTYTDGARFVFTHPLP